MSITKTLLRHLTLVTGLLVGVVAMTPARAVAQTNGNWITAGGGSWPTTSNWNGDNVADGTGATGTFAQDIPATTTYTVTLDGNRTIGNLSFTDTNVGTVGSWLVAPGTSGTLTLAVSSGSSTLTVATNSFATISAIVAGSGGLVKSGAGTMFLSGINTYTGNTAVNAGTLEVVSADALGATGVGNNTVVASGARVRIGGDVTTNENFSIAGNGISGAINFGSSQSGVNVSTATISGQVTLTAISRMDVATNSTGKFDRLGQGGHSIDLTTFTGTFAGGGTLYVNSPIISTGAGAGQGNLTMNGSGSVFLAAANTYTGTTGFGTATGTLYLGSGGTAGSLSTSSPITISNAGATFAVYQSDTVTQGTDFSASAISGPGKFNQNGSGTTILTAANTYAGTTSVNAGTLLINGNQSGATGAVTVQSAATLGGSGTTGGAVSILGGGVFAPGNSSSVGTFTSSNKAFTLADTSVLNFQLNAGNNTVGGGINDLATGVQNLTLDGVLNITSLGGDWTNVADNTKWRLFDYSGTLTDNTLTIGARPSSQPWQRWEIDTATTGQVNLVIVPEPSTYMLLSSVAIAGLFVRRRRA